MFLWFEHAVSDRISDRRQAAIAPEPSSTGKIRTDGRADAAGAMAAGAGCPRDLTMKNLFAEGDLLAGRSLRNRQRGRLYAGIWIDAFRRKNVRRCFGLDGRRWRGLNADDPGSPM